MGHKVRHSSIAGRLHNHCIPTLWWCVQVCDALGVELEVVPLTKEYWERVVSDSVAQIRAGRTPNPDMLCNSRVKFGAFMDFLEARNALSSPQELASTSCASHKGSIASAGVTGTPPSSTEEAPVMQFDRVASGHYACIVREQQSEAAALRHGGSELAQTGGNGSGSGCGHRAPCGTWLHLSPDPVKDQSYFLAQLSPQQLSRVMFPLGSLTKAQVCIFLASGF